MTGGWRPALRIAWRTARRHRGRTALVMVLVALPVLVGGFLDVVARTAQLPAEEKVRRVMGTADAYVQIAYCAPIADVEYFDHRPGYVAEPECVERPAVDLAQLLPAGTSFVPANTIGEFFARVHHGETSARLPLQELDVASPLYDGLIRLRDGRWPARQGEVAATAEALARLNAGVGDTVTVDGGPTVTIVGAYVHPDSLGWGTMLGLHGWTGLAPADGAERQVEDTFLVDLPEGVDAPGLQRELLADGVALAPRADVLDPPEHQVAPTAGLPVDFQTVGLIALVIGFGLLEVTLLAGTAFAVSARRQVRDLGLVAATGGEARHVRRIVVAQGAVIGLVGAVVAIPVGIATVFVGRPWLDNVNGALLGPLDVRPLELAALVAVGILAGLAAALVPAFTAARIPVLDALNKRFRTTSLRARWPRLGIAMLVAGVAVSAAGAGLWRAGQIEYDKAYERYEEANSAAQQSLGLPTPPAPPSDSLYLGLMLLGFSLAALGLAVGAPALVAAVARVGRRLPLSMRLALRDAGRHRHRTGPAVAAVMTAVAGSVALSFFVLSSDTQSDKDYRWGLRLGQADVYYPAGEPGGPSPERVLAAVRNASAELPTREVVPIHAAVAADANLQTGEGWPSIAVVSPGCREGNESSNIGAAITDGSGFAVYQDVPRAAQAGLADPGVIVTSCEYIRDGEVTLDFWTGEGKQFRSVVLPAVYVAMPEAWDLPSVWISPEVAADAGLAPMFMSVVIDTTRVPTVAEEDAAVAALEDELGTDYGYIRVERGYESDTSVAFLMLLGGSAFVTLVGTAIAVALSGAEGRPDHATLLAVGADPRRRRFLAMGQAATVSVLGVGLGVILGTIVGSAILGGHERLPFVVPWPTLIQIALGIPLVGVLIAGLFTRSRLPMDRRIG